MLPLPDDARQLERVCDRLRSAPESRLVRADATLTGGSLAGAVHALAEWAAAVAGESAEPVPRLNPLASGDQLAVLGGDLLRQLDRGAVDDADAVRSEWRRRLDEVARAT